MQITDLLKFTKKMKEETRDQRTKYEPKRLDKIDNYVDMIIARSMYIKESAVKSQKYMEEIEDALVRLDSYGVDVPGKEKKTINNTENPLKNL